MPYLTLLLALLLSFTSLAQAPVPSCRALLEEMRATENPVSHLTFRQITSFYKADTIVQEQTWWEALTFPHKLHIRFGDFETGNGVIFNQGQRYYFKGGQQIKSLYKQHELMLFSSGLRLNPVDSSLHYLAAFGIDTSQVALAEIEGRRCYGIGAAHPDEEKNQLWIDAERLYFKQSKLYVDGHWQKVRFSDFKAIASEQYVETSVAIWLDGDLYMTEWYQDLQMPEQLAPALFDPNQFKTSDWR